MGTIISKIEEVDRIRWTQLRKGRVANAKRVLAVDETQVIIELANGEYTVAGRRHSPNGNWAVLHYGLDRFTSKVLDGLVKLGVLTKDQAQRHKVGAKESSEAAARRMAMNSLKHSCETLGIPVPEVPE